MSDYSINYASAAPGIAQFQASVAAGDQARRQEEADFAARLALERQRGGMKTANEAIQSYYAAQQPSVARAGPAPVAATPMTPMAAPPPPAASAPAALPAAAAPPSPSGAAAVPSMVNPAAIADLRAKLGIQGSGGPPVQDFGNEAPLSPAAAGAPPSQVSVPSAPPATTNPITGFSAQPRTAMDHGTTAERAGFRAMMDKLTSNPDTSQAALNMFAADQAHQMASRKENRAVEHEGMTLFAKAATDSDIGMMRLLNQRYRLGIPDPIINSREAMANLAATIKTVKGLGITDDGMALATAGAYLGNLGKGMDQNSAMQDAMRQGRQAYTPQVAHIYPGAGNEPVLVGKRGENVGAPGRPLPLMRPPREAAGGSKLTLSRQDMVEALVQIGWDRKKATEHAYGVGKGLSLGEPQKATLARQLWSADQQQLPSRRKFESFQDAKDVVDGMYGGGAPAAAPASQTDPLGIR